MIHRFKFILFALKAIVLLLIFNVFFTACKKDSRPKEFVLRIRLPDEPDCLHPVVSQSGYATQIESMIMPPLFEYDVVNMDPASYLLEKLTEPELVNDSTLAYKYQIFKEAVWEDGRPVQSSDILYTLKSSLNPFLKNKTYAGFFKNIRDLIVDSTNPKSIQILVNKNYMLHREMSGNYSIYPEHIYDPKKVLHNFSFKELLSQDSATLGAQRWSQLKEYANEYQSQDFCRNKIVGCGPYKLLSWQSGSKIILERKKNWWGDSLANQSSMLKAYPDKIEYWILPDENNALLELEKGNIDIMAEITPRLFVDLQKKNPANISYANPAVPQYNYIEINHRRPALADESVRIALSKLIDIKSFIQKQYFDLAVPVSSPVHPSKSYFNSELSGIVYNPNESIRLLNENQWSDTDKDGILDKLIKGKKEKLEFKFLIPNREASKKFAILFQEEAKKVGIQLNVDTKEAASLLADLNSLNFDLAMSAIRQSPAPWDPYQSWSSKNTQAGGFNKSGYATSFTDELINTIRTSTTDSIRNRAYKLLQKDLHDHVAQIFLFAPKERIAYNKKLEVVTGPRKPGYYEAWVRIK